jgi:hypothetical protein
MRSAEAAGIMRIIVSGSDTPCERNISTTRSTSAESLPWGINRPGQCSSASRLRTALRLALIVLISPLWPSVRKGCARYQLENVLVEYRRW